MSQTIQQKQIEYFTKYAGSCLEIWNSVVGRQITHYRHGPGTVVKIRKIKDGIIKDGICVEVQFAERLGSINFKFETIDYYFSMIFTRLTLPREVEKELETRYQKLTDIKRFSGLSEKAMNPNPNVRAHFPLPQLDEYDIQLVGEWCTLLNNLDRSSLIELIKTDSKAKWEAGRLLSARSAEKIARDFYQNYGKEVKDVSITQIEKNKKSDWREYDLDVEGLPVDVKNSRRSQKSKDRYTEHCIPQFKRSRTNQNVTISGVLSPYLWPLYLLEERPEDAKIIFLGETDLEKQSILKSEFKNLVDFVGPNSANKNFLPPWVFDYPEYVYTEQNKAREELKDFTNLASLKGIVLKFDLIPVGIAADIEEILDNEALDSLDSLDSWERNFLNQLRNRIEKHGLSLPFLFLTILTHFLGMADSSETISDFKPDKYRKFLFYKKEERNNPLGIYDPLKTIDSLIEALGTLWTAEKSLIREFCRFRLKSFNILEGKSDLNENLWTTLIAYCGGRLEEDGSACGKNPLVLGESKRCKYGKLICSACKFCCGMCKGGWEPTSSAHGVPTDEFKPADPPIGASGAGGSDGYPRY